MMRTLALLLISAVLLLGLGCGGSTPVKKVDVSGNWSLAISSPTTNAGTQSGQNLGDFIFGGSTNSIPAQISFEVAIAQSGAGLTLSQYLPPATSATTTSTVTLPPITLGSYLSLPNVSGSGTIAGTKLTFTLTDSATGESASGCTLEIQGTLIGSSIQGTYTARDSASGSGCKLTSGMVAMTPIKP